MSHDSYRLAVPVGGCEPTEGLEQSIRTAAELVRDRDRTGDLLIVSLLQLPEQTSLDRSNIDDSRLQKADDTATQLMRVSEETGVIAEKTVQAVHHGATPIVELAANDGCEGVFVNTDTSQSKRQPVLSAQAAIEISTRAEADVFVRKLVPGSNTIQRILLTVGGGPHSALATEAARALAIAHNAQVDITHIYSEDAATDLGKETMILQQAEETLSGIELFETGLLPSDNAAEKIVDRSQKYDVTVLGAPTTDLLRQLVFGTTAGESENSRAANAVLMARQHSKKKQG